MKIPKTSAIRELESHRAEFKPHFYRYEDRGGTRVSAQALGVPESHVIKTLVFEDDGRNAYLVLMPGHLEVSTKLMARLVGVKTIRACSPDVARKHSGYQVGGTSPFGFKRKVPVYMDAHIPEITECYINGGKRGFLVSLSPKTIIQILQPTVAPLSQSC